MLEILLCMHPYTFHLMFISTAHRTHDVQVVLSQNTGPAVDGFARAVKDTPWEGKVRHKSGLSSYLLKNNHVVEKVITKKHQ